MRIDEADAVGLPTAARTVLVLGLVAIVAYVAGWAVAGSLREGYDPTERAVSELFERGAPSLPRALVVGGLMASGAAFLALVPVLHRGLPGRGLAGPVLVALAGIGTLGVVAAPCSPGCPGAGATLTDTWHGITAGVGYGGLVLAPVAFAWRLRTTVPRLATWSAVLGGLSVALLAVHATGLVEARTGLQQRVYNTVADAWYLLVIVWLLRHGTWRSGRSVR